MGREPGYSLKVGCGMRRFIIIVGLVHLIACSRVSEVRQSLLAYPVEVTGIPLSPTGINEVNFNLRTDADFYRYKLGFANDIDCSESYDYSILQPISESISYENLLDGHYALCVRGVFKGLEDSPLKPFLYGFTIDKVAPSFPELNFSVYQQAKLSVAVHDLSTPIQMRWSQVAGPGKLIFNDIYSETPTIELPSGQTGEYTLAAEAVDAAGNQQVLYYKMRQTTKEQTVPAVHLNKKIVTNMPRFISGSVAGESPLSYEWQLLDQTHELAWLKKFNKNADLDVTALQLLEDRRYLFRLSVIDKFKHTSHHDVEYIVDRQAPYVEAGSDIYVQGGRSVWLRGLVNDAYGIQRLQWVQVEGKTKLEIKNPHRLNTEVILPSSGIAEVKFALRVVDLAGNVSVDTMRIITDKDRPKIEVDENFVVMGHSYGLKQVRVWDIAPVNLLWKQLSGPTDAAISGRRSLNPNFYFSSPGNYKVQLAVTDLAGNHSEAITSFSVSEDVFVVGDNKNDTVTESNPESNNDEKLLTEVNLPQVYGLQEDAIKGKRFVQPVSEGGHSDFKYSWKVLAGKNQGKLRLLNPQSARTEIIGRQDGHFELELSLQNNYGQISKKRFNYYWDMKPPKVKTKLRINAESIALVADVEEEEPEGVHIMWQQDSMAKIDFDSTSDVQAKILTSPRPGDYNVKLKACDKFENCSIDSVSLRWPKNAHYLPEDIAWGLKTNKVMVGRLVNFPVLNSKPYTCEVEDLNTLKKQKCYCEGGQCDVSVSLEEEFAIRHFKYRILQNTENLFESFFSMNNQQSALEKQPTLSH